MRVLLPILALVVVGVIAVELYRASLEGQGPAPVPIASRRIVCQTLFCADVAADIAPEADGPVIAWPEVARNPRFSLIADAAALRPITPSPAESIVALRPDLVVVATYSRADTLAQLEALGVPLLSQTDPRSFDDIRAGVLTLGAALGRKAQAADLVSRLDQRLAEVADAVRGLVPLRALAWFDGSVPGGDTTVQAALIAAGAVNAADSLRGWAQIDQERLIALRPDVIVVPLGDDRVLPAGLLASPTIQAWQGQGGRVVGVRSALLGTASHHLAELAAEFARLIHGVTIP